MVACTSDGKLVHRSMTVVAERQGQTPACNILCQRDGSVTHWLTGQRTAVALVQRDIPGLQAEVDFEQVIAGKDRTEGRGPLKHG